MGELPYPEGRSHQGIDFFAGTHGDQSLAVAEIHGSEPNEVDDLIQQPRQNTVKVFECKDLKGRKPVS
jgi:hypothetical protein